MELEDKKAELKIVTDACSIYQGWQIAVAKEVGVSREVLKHMIIGQKYVKEGNVTILDRYDKAIKESRRFLIDSQNKAEELSKLMKEIKRKK